ncbi:hypothetical protein LSAT2_025044 [Lamellibrachia satsuma]|nr:hypothetical protein LSAT2_025044 [Lamellibrachia satsuma]
MPDGKYFFILSKQNGLVLEVAEELEKGGRAWLRDTFDTDSGQGGAHQLWYKDHGVGTIRCKLHDLCLDVNDNDEVVVGPYTPGRDEQQWMTAHDVIVNSTDVNKVFAVQGDAPPEDAMGVRVVKPIEGDISQMWHYHHVPANYFFIRSELNGNVVELRPSNRGVSWMSKLVRRLKPSSSETSAADGGSFVLRLSVKNPYKKSCQLWYEDRDSVLHSQLDNLVVDVSSKRASMIDKLTAATLRPGSTEPLQLAAITRERISSKTDSARALTIKGYEGQEGAKIYMCPYNGRTSQHWVFEHELYEAACNYSDDSDNDVDDLSGEHSTSQVETECEQCR